jgi:hypothetical protein
MSEMHNPPHPGLTLRDDVLPALHLQVLAWPLTRWRSGGVAGSTDRV